MYLLQMGVKPIVSFFVISSLALFFSCSPDTFAGPASYTLFESGQVRPLALSPNGRRLFAVNTPDNRLEVFSVNKNGLAHCGSVAVGMEPVAVAARNASEVWVVNHLSDSVSIVKIAEKACNNDSVPGRVVRTLLVGDEPRDIVFAGSDDDDKRAFITTAHRGQNSPIDPQLTTPGVGRADVWVFDADHTGNGIGGSPLNIITLFTDTPRALAVSPDGTKVYAAGFHTGTKTTTIFHHNVSANGGLPGPLTNFVGEQQPATGLIVKHDGDYWRDELGRIWNDNVRFNLPDKDVFVIDATASPPVEISSYNSVGATIFNMIANPVTGAVYVANTDAANEVRFEGPGIFAGSTTRGSLHKSHITVLKNGNVIPRHINKHIDYSSCCQPIPNDENNRSLAFPLDMAISSNGKTLYVAALGSAKVGIFDTAALEDNSFVPDDNNHVELTGGGPTGVVLDEKHNRLYVLTRFDNSVSVVDVKQRKEVDHLAMYNPEPEHIVKGRRFLYDARYTSSRGDSACASCHVFGDLDALAWDLGNPDATTLENTSPLVVHPASVGFDVSIHFRPMKGPMTTQSLRGLANHGSQHWRGDRNGGHLGEPNEQPDSGVYNEAEAFRQFNPAFFGLVGRHAPLPPEDMQAFTDFALELTYPPNPIRALDNSLTAEQQAGRDFFFGQTTNFGLSDPFAACNGCHIVDPDGNAEYGVKKPGFYGADGRATFELGPQIFKVPHLRNLYQKVGMFGMARTPGGFIIPESDDANVPNVHMGDQVRGFGFFHDGSIDSIFRFLNIIVFQHADGGPFPNPGGFAIGPEGDVQRRQAEQFVLAFPSNMAPAVGQQVTLNYQNMSAAMPRLQLLMARADAGECDLVAKRNSRDREQGYIYQTGTFMPDQAGKQGIGVLPLVMTSNRGITFTCAPPGSGIRMGIDRDEDGVLDGDEV